MLAARPPLWALKPLQAQDSSLSQTQPLGDPPCHQPTHLLPRCDGPLTRRKPSACKISTFPSLVSQALHNLGTSFHSFHSFHYCPGPSLPPTSKQKTE